MLLENGKYTEKIHEMSARDVWKAWKAQQLNMGQVNDWQNRHNHFFNISTQDQAPRHNYNIYTATELEKYNFLNIARSEGAYIAGVSGCGTGYYIQITATDRQAEIINARLEAGA